MYRRSWRSEVGLAASWLAPIRNVALPNIPSDPHFLAPQISGELANSETHKWPAFRRMRLAGSA
jgi:hypothetical protein